MSNDRGDACRETQAMDDEYELEAPAPATPADAEQIRARAAEDYMRQARQPKGTEPKPPPAPTNWPFLRGVFLFPWQLSSIAPWMFITIGLTLSALSITMCYHLMHFDVTFGKVLGLPAGCITAAALSYASAAYLSIIQGTSEGYHAIQEWPDENWRDWFWTLPSTLGMLFLAWIPGYALLQAFPSEFWLPLWVTMWFLYPIFQLSTLETGQISLPLSKAILKTLVTHTPGWLMFYLETGLLGAGYLALAYFSFVDPPYITMVILGPAAATFIMIYGRLLGRLAWYGSTRDGHLQNIAQPKKKKKPTTKTT